MMPIGAGCWQSIIRCGPSRRASRAIIWWRRCTDSTAIGAWMRWRRWPAGWPATSRPVGGRPSENAAVEVWLTIDGRHRGVRSAPVGSHHAPSHLEAGTSAGIAAADGRRRDGAPGRAEAGHAADRSDVRRRHHPGRGHRLRAAASPGDAASLGRRLRGRRRARVRVEPAPPRSGSAGALGRHALAAWRMPVPIGSCPIRRSANS